MERFCRALRCSAAAILYLYNRSLVHSHQRMGRPYDGGKMVYLPLVSILSLRAALTAFAAIITFLHLNGWALLVGVNLDGHNAHNIFVQTHQAFHFLNRRCRAVCAHHRIVTFAV